MRAHAATSALLLLLLLLVLSGCSRTEAPGPAPSGETPLQITRGFTMTESDSGVVQYVLHASVARFYADNVTRAEDIRVDFHDRGRKASQLTAREGFVDEDGRLRARGDVIVVSEEGYVLRTQSLYWDRAQEKIRTDEFFTVTKKGEVFKGYGLTTGPRLDLLEVDRGFEGTVVDEGREQR